MDKRQLILDELNGICPVISAIGPASPYTVPDDYFASLPAIIMNQVLLFQNKHTSTYQVPAGYFNGLAERVLHKIKRDHPVQEVNEVSAELEAIAPLLNSLSKKTVYRVPDGYFDTVSALSVQANRKPAVVFSLKTARKWMHYTAAAVVGGLLVTGAFHFTDKESLKADYEQYSGIDIPTALDKISDDDLKKYLTSHEHFTIALPEAQAPVSTGLSDVKENIRLLSDEELTTYLNENGGEPQGIRQNEEKQKEDSSNEEKSE